MATRVPTKHQAANGESGGSEAPTGRTVALVDLRDDPLALPVGHSEGAATVSGAVLRKIEQVIRGEDRVCPFGVARLAVAFGPDADSVTPKRLAERLARAIRLSAAVDGPSSARPSGIPIGPNLPDPSAEGDTAREPIHAGAPSRAPSTATVTVDRAIAQLRHRTVVRCTGDGFARYGTRHDDMTSEGERGTLLVVSPSRTSAVAPGPSALAAAATAERLGFDVDVFVLTCDEDPVLEVRGKPAELVVLVVEGEREPAGESASWASSMWHIPSQLAANYRAAGIEVLAVWAGGGAGALAGCVAEGANLVLGLEDLQHGLVEIDEVSAAEETWVAAPGGGRVPETLVPLMLLTASERRVLFYLTTGRSAQKIAEDLVVSVTTVRSHIRSILRKLGVRSQLAAVAIANGRDFAGTRSSHGDPEVRRDLDGPSEG